MIEWEMERIIIYDLYVEVVELIDVNTLDHRYVG